MRHLKAKGRLRTAAHQTAVNQPPKYISNLPKWSKRVYAICFDMDTEALKNHYHNGSWNNAYDDIRRVLEKFGFNRQQGSVYFGDEHVDPVKCVLAIQSVSNSCSWFRVSVKDVRMLRIEENNDLMPAVGDPVLPLDGSSSVAAAE
jgi:virulence-associated protein VapD